MTENMRLKSAQATNDINDVKAFAEWIIKIGEGDMDHENYGESTIEIPNDLLIKVSDDPISSIISSTYLNLLDNLNSLNYFQERAILAPKLKDSDRINDHVFSQEKKKFT